MSPGQSALESAPGEALSLQYIYTFLLQPAEPLVQLCKGLRHVGQVTGLLGLVYHISQGQSQGREQPTVPEGQVKVRVHSAAKLWPSPSMQATTLGTHL